MKLIEAMKKLRVIEKRMSDNAEKIHEYAAYVSTERLPFESEGYDPETIARLRPNHGAKQRAPSLPVGQERQPPGATRDGNDPGGVADGLVHRGVGPRRSGCCEKRRRQHDRARRFQETTPRISTGALRQKRGQTPCPLEDHPLFRRRRARPTASVRTSRCTRPCACFSTVASR